MKKKKGFIVLLIVLIVLAIGIGALYFFFVQKKNDTIANIPSKVVKTLGAESSTSTTDIFGVYGITGVKTIDATFPVSGMESGLEIEEIYISSGDTVTADTQILKFTDESVATVRKELKESLRSKELSYRSAAIEYEQNKITYAYNRDVTLLEGKQADTVYNETVSNLSTSVDRAKEALDEANEQIAEYEEAINTNSYYTAYKEAENLYNSDLELIKKKLDEWGVNWEEITRGVRYDYSTPHAQYVTVLSMLYSVLENEEKAMETAKSEYETAVASLSSELQILKLSLPGLEADYASAKESYESSLLDANLTKQQSLNKAETAEKEYETNIEKAESDYENAKDDYEDAKEALETFENCAGTGTLIALKEGTILRTSVRKGRSVTSDTSIYTVSDPEKMTVSASVYQEDIAKVAVGDTAIVYEENSGTFYATVTSINPISSSSNASKVTYSVTLELSGDFSSLSANETVSVYFGMGGN